MISHEVVETRQEFVVSPVLDPFMGKLDSRAFMERVTSLEDIEEFVIARIQKDIGRFIINHKMDDRYSPVDMVRVKRARALAQMLYSHLPPQYDDEESSFINLNPKPKIGDIQVGILRNSNRGFHQEKITGSLEVKKRDTRVFELLGIA